MADSQRSPTVRWRVVALWSLLALFCLRVLAQLTVAAVPIPFIPPFDAWHSGALPYPVLVLLQIVIIVVLVRIARGFATGRTHPSRRASTALLAFGSIYFGAMLTRIVLGETVLRDSSWFRAHIPSFFHLVLASFLLVAGHIHHTEWARGDVG